jgi:hypothetical protein
MPAASERSITCRGRCSASTPRRIFTNVRAASRSRPLLVGRVLPELAERVLPLGDDGLEAQQLLLGQRPARDLPARMPREQRLGVVSYRSMKS